eukprot:768174-Hanusia_phi.AAC.6
MTMTVGRALHGPAQLLPHTAKLELGELMLVLTRGRSSPGTRTAYTPFALSARPAASSARQPLDLLHLQALKTCILHDEPPL